MQRTLLRDPPTAGKTACTPVLKFFSTASKTVFSMEDIQLYEAYFAILTTSERPLFIQIVMHIRKRLAVRYMSLWEASSIKSSNCTCIEISQFVQEVNVCHLPSRKMLHVYLYI